MDIFKYLYQIDECETNPSGNCFKYIKYENTGSLKLKGLLVAEYVQKYYPVNNTYVSRYNAFAGDRTQPQTGFLHWFDTENIQYENKMFGR